MKKKAGTVSFKLCAAVLVGFILDNLFHSIELFGWSPVGNVELKALEPNSTLIFDAVRKAMLDIQLNSTHHGFDAVRKAMYVQAVAPLSNQTRNPFVLDRSWKRGTGGLDDQDRRILGDLYLNATSVFEYGLGESTLIAAQVGVPRYAGVDSDATWVAKARKKSGKKRFRFYFADIGETAAWGNPTMPSLAKIAYNYQIAPMVAEEEAFDVYLVDGRYRVACACVAFLHAIQRGGDLERVRVGIHDNDRSEYHVFTEVADVVVNAKKLW
eukprot:CAMPEP_0183310760 /NCGR_PEP_ID=MMETSP0160_2-20130417/33091_1 /TAXON_ID=2839 ORGANISM="Odontella Sinensis, Strain Grunow 1884" /NCGR_SAMPLE_ID=MMETSP0160_2 /ASSEMBLY_ACC=CAM_ASM_000250 /LENGTH=268 /DNA_ID=CAMNT_0025475113 /DNA_START=11 /DNA_END=814 /DNA_ORIENTATION=+